MNVCGERGYTLGLPAGFCLTVFNLLGYSKDFHSGLHEEEKKSF